MMAELGLNKNGAPELDCSTGPQVRTAELGLVKNGAPAHEEAARYFVQRGAWGCELAVITAFSVFMARSCPVDYPLRTWW